MEAISTPDLLKSDLILHNLKNMVNEDVSTVIMGQDSSIHLQEEDWHFMKTIQQIDLRPKMQRFSTLDSNPTDNVSIDSPHKITVHNSIVDKN